MTSNQIVDFSEIPETNYDDWECLSKSFLEGLGYRVALPPGRGPDGGCDMIVADNRGIKYVVSCKHFANSGHAVCPADERDIGDRVKMRGATGFIGVYSTVPSQGLVDKLEGLKRNCNLQDYQIYTGRNVEHWLLCNGVFLRMYFPKSYLRLKAPGAVTTRHVPLRCCICGADLTGKDGWIFSPEEVWGEKVIVKRVLSACKGRCIDMLEDKLWRLYPNENMSFPSEEISWYDNAAGYLWRQQRIMDEVRRGVRFYSDEAWAEEMSVFYALSQVVMRPATQEEMELTGMLANLCDG